MFCHIFVIQLLQIFFHWYPKCYKSSVTPIDNLKLVVSLKEITECILFTNEKCDKQQLYMIN